MSAKRTRPARGKASRRLASLRAADQSFATVSERPLPPPWLVWLPVLGPAMVASHIARAQPPSPELMAKLAAASEGFDEIRKRASYSVEHRLETIDREGHVVGVEAAD